MKKVKQFFASSLGFYKNGREYSILLVLIIFFGSLLRLYNLPFRYSLGEETVRDAVVGIESARQLQLPLTGAFSSLGPFTFGPLYTYQLAFSYLIFPFSYSPWIYLSIISILYIFVMYKIGEILENKSFGLILAFLAAISPAQIISATHLTSHNNTNIFAVLTIWIFLKILRKNISYWWGFFLGIFLGFGMNLHYQITGLFILILLLVVYKPKRYLYFVTASAGIFVTFIPLLIFELNNHWFNLRNMLYYFFHGRYAMYVPNRWLFYVRDFWPSFWADALGVPLAGGYIALTIVVIIFSIVIIKRKLSISLVALLICFLFNFVLLRYYWGHRFFGYLNFLRPFVFIFTGFAILYISKINKYGKYLAGVAFFLLVSFALSQAKAELVKDPFSMNMYEEVAILEKKFPGKNFTMYGCTKKYRGSYNSQTFSLAFLLDKNSRSSDSGMKIGLKSADCTNLEDVVNSSLPIKVSDKIIEGTDLIDISSSTKESLAKTGWEVMNFKYIYNLNARWWFKEQP